MGDHWIARIEEGREQEAKPLHMLRPPPDAGVVGLALDRVQLPAALGPGAAPPTQKPPVCRGKGPGGKLLDHGHVQSIPERSPPKPHGVPLQSGLCLVRQREVLK